jgi:DNA-binding transcriptional MocR family regulator
LAKAAAAWLDTQDQVDAAPRPHSRDRDAPAARCPIPTVRSVVTSCTVNPTTVLKAYRELELSGLVEARHGAGTFVSGTLGHADAQSVISGMLAPGPAG